LKSGIIGYSCSVCEEGLTNEQKNDPNFHNYKKEVRGCDRPTQTPLELLETDEEWYNCPIKFVSKAVNEFYDKMQSYQDGLSTPPDFDQQSYKFNDALKLYKYYLGIFLERKGQ
jgi:hypothetical protein